MSEGTSETDFSGPVLDVTPNDTVLDKDYPERLGHPVLVSHGPEWGHACPIIKGARPKVEASRGVIFQLDLDRPQHCVILKRYQEVASDGMPVVAVAKPGQEERYAGRLRNVQVWAKEPTVAELDGFAALLETSDDLRDAR